MARLPRMLAATLLACVSVPATAKAAEADFGVAIHDIELAQMRGGFVLPNGIDVMMVITTETRVDGAMVLRSVLMVDQGAPQFTVFARSADGSPELRAIDPATGAESTVGTVRLTSSGGVQRLVLNGSDFGVTNLFGGAIGSVVANSGDNRTFDVSTVVDLTLSNTSPALVGSTLSQINNIASDVAARLSQ